MHFKVEDGWESYKQCHLPTLQIKDYKQRNFLDQPIKNDLKAYDDIRTIVTGQGNDYTTEYLLDYSYSKNYYKLIEIDLRKQN